MAIILTTEQITEYVLTATEGDGYWVLNYDPATNRPQAVKYTFSETRQPFPVVYGSDIRELLASPAAIALGRPPLPNAINLFKDALLAGEIDQFNFSQAEVIGVSTIHVPENLVVDYGLLHGVKLFLLWASGYDWAKAQSNLAGLLHYKKITYAELEEELQHMVDGDTYPFQSEIITQQQADDFLESGLQNELSQL